MIEVRRPLTAFPAALALAAALLVSGGCGSDKATGPNRVPLNLRVEGVGGSSQALLSTPRLAASIAAADTDTMVTLTRALLVVRDIRFAMPGGNDEQEDTLGVGDGDSTDVDSDHDGGQVRFHGPFVIDLLAGDAQDLGTQMVPAGVYHHIMGHLQALAHGGSLAGQYPDLVGATVLLEGDVNGDGGGHFVFESRIDTEFIIHGSFEVTGDTPVTTYLVFDLSQFLRGQGGAFLDPRDPANENAIRVAIKHAVKVGIDRDHDGVPEDDLAVSR